MTTKNTSNCDSYIVEIIQGCCVLFISVKYKIIINMQINIQSTIYKNTNISTKYI